jgi:hypothetical protein
VKGKKRGQKGFAREEDEIEAMAEFMDLMEDDMSWSEPKVMSAEMRDILKAARNHPDKAIPPGGETRI